METTFSQEVREQAYNAFNSYCCVKDCYERAVDFHHKLENTEYYRKKFFFFLQSIFNCAPCCRHHHEHHAQYPELNISEQLAKVYEKFLESLFDKGIDEGRISCGCDK